MRLALLQPRKVQWLFIAAVVFVVVPAVLVLATFEDVSVALLERFERPGLQRSLGFSAGEVSLPGHPGHAKSVFAVVAVREGGPFWQAGVRAGDVPVGYKHGFKKGFLFDLAWGKREGSVELKFMRLESLAQNKWETQRTVKVLYPPE